MEAQPMIVTFDPEKGELSMQIGQDTLVVDGMKREGKKYSRVLQVDEQARVAKRIINNVIR